MILLTRIDPQAGMNHWYLVNVQPTLLEEIAVVCAWGSRETLFQQTRIIPVRSRKLAQKLADEIVARKISRGYRYIETEPQPASTSANLI